MVKSLWGGRPNLTFQRHFGSEQTEQGYCFSNPCHEGLGSPKKHLGWQWGDMISLSQCAHGNLASRKELTKGFVGATRHGVTGQDPAGSGGFACCHLAQGQLGSVFPCSRTELRFDKHGQTSSCLWVAKPCSRETRHIEVLVWFCCCFLAFLVIGSCKAVHSRLGCPTRLSPSSKGLSATWKQRWTAGDWALASLNIGRE